MNISQDTLDLITQTEALADQLGQLGPGIPSHEEFMAWDAAYTKAVNALSAEYLDDPQRLAYAQAQGQALLDALCFVFGLRDEYVAAGKIRSCAGARLKKAMGMADE